jgi:hypothetical protein
VATSVAAALAAELGLRTAAELHPAAGARTADAPRPAEAGPAAEARAAALVGAARSEVLPPPKAILPVTPDISALLPYGGLATVTAITASARGATSLLWRLLAGPSRAGAWCALVGMPRVYPLAATAAGVDLGRVALVDPGPRIAEAAGALAEGVAAIVVPSEALSPAQARRLAARARGSGTSIVWWETRPVAGADARLQVARAHWKGLRENAGRRWGAGRLDACELEVAARWRSGGVRRASIWPYGGRPGEPLPDPRGRAAEPHAEPRDRAGHRTVVNLRSRAAEPSSGERPAQHLTEAGDPAECRTDDRPADGTAGPQDGATAVVDLRTRAAEPHRPEGAAEARGVFRPAARVGGGERR